MKVLFCGTLASEHIEFQIKGISAAGNRFQCNMIKNMQELGYEVYTCSYLGITLPDEIKDELKREEQLRKNKCQYVFKEKNMILCIIQYYKKMLKVLKSVDIVICYNIIYAWLLLPYIAKGKGKKCIVIVADYSESISYQRAIHKIYAKLQLLSMQGFDIVIGLSLNIHSKLKKKQNFILMEGGIDQTFYDMFSNQVWSKEPPFILMYSGLLSEVTGLRLLLKAMQQIHRQDIKLIITGKGPLEKEVKQAVIADERICYKGYLTYEEYVEQLHNADILINPRNMNLPENRNNFPSKIMEYLATGKLILSTKFAGWEKFEKNVIFCESNADGIQRGIEDIIGKWGDRELYYRSNRGRAKQFEWKEQIRRILEQ